MILQNNKRILKIVKETEFKLEKDIQNLVENNMTTLLGYEFLATEFSIGCFRFDSVAFDNDSNSFVIVEYKKTKNESLVDQGLSYLSTLILRRADFALLYNQKKNVNKGLDDFDWGQTRVVFISPKYTKYQLKAASFKNLPFSFYEIKQFANDCVEFNEVLIEKEEIANINILDNGNKSANNVVTSPLNVIKVYTEDDHIANGSDEIVELYKDLRDRVLSLGNIKIEPKKMYIAFKGVTNVCDITLTNKKMIVMINLKKGKMQDNNKFAKLMLKDNGEKIGHWGNGDYQCSVDKESQLDYLMTLIRQSYDVNKA